MLVGDPAGGLEEEERAPERALAHELLLGVDREHLEDDAARPELRQPEVAERVGVPTLPLVEDAQQEVVVGVGDRQEGAAPGPPPVPSRAPSRRVTRTRAGRRP